MTSVFSFSQNLSEFRALIQKGESSETVAKSLLENLKQSMIKPNFLFMKHWRGWSLFYGKTWG
jgi:hypothetical protein